MGDLQLHFSKSQKDELILGPIGVHLPTLTRAIFLNTTKSKTRGGQREGERERNNMAKTKKKERGSLPHSTREDRHDILRACVASGAVTRSNELTPSSATVKKQPLEFKAPQTAKGEETPRHQSDAPQTPLPAITCTATSAGDRCATHTHTPPTSSAFRREV